MKVKPDGIAVFDRRNGVWTGTFQDSTSEEARDGAWRAAESIEGCDRSQLIDLGCELVEVALVPVHNGQVLFTQRQERILAAEISDGESRVNLNARHREP